MLQVLYKTNQLIAFNKPVGIAVQPDKTGDPSFLQQAEAYCKHTLYLIHRIDRPVSGIVLFAQVKSAVASLTAQIQDHIMEREYLAVVQNLPELPEGRLEHYIRKNQAKNTSIASTEPVPGADHAVLEYKVIGSTDRYHLLHVRLLTGRHHQIRAQLAAIGCPIKGDVKYGARRGNPDRSIHLHAWRVAFDHPVSGERVQLEAAIPDTDPVWQSAAALLKG